MVRAIREDVRDTIIAQIPVGRLAEPEEIARVASFLTADESGYITGADFYVNGGLYLH